MSSRIVSDTTVASSSTTRVITPTQTGTPKLTVSTPRKTSSAITTRQPSLDLGHELTRDPTWTGPAASTPSQADACDLGPDARELSEILESSLTSRLPHEDAQLFEEFGQIHLRQTSADSVFEAELGDKTVTTANPFADENKHGQDPLLDHTNRGASDASSQPASSGAQVVRSSQAGWFSTHCRRLSHALSVASLYEKQNTTQTPTHDRSLRESRESILEDTAVDAQTLETIERAQERSMTVRLKHKLENAKLKLTERRTIRGLGFIRMRSPSRKPIIAAAQTQHALPDTQSAMMSAEISSTMGNMHAHPEPLLGGERIEIPSVPGGSCTQDNTQGTSKSVENDAQNVENRHEGARQGSSAGDVKRTTRSPQLPPGAWSRSGYEPKRKKEDRKSRSKSSQSGDWGTRFFLPL